MKGAITRLMKYIYGEEMPNEPKRKTTLRRAGTTGIKDDTTIAQDPPSASKKERDVGGRLVY